MTTKKISFPTFEVDLWKDDGSLKETLIVRPAPFNKIGEIKELQIKLMEAYEASNGCLGELLADESVTENMRKISSLLKVVGKQDLGMDFENLYNMGDIVQMGRIFFSESINAEMKSPGYVDIPTEDGIVKAYQFPEHRLNPLPSAIARIHDLAFFKILIDIRQKREEEEKQKEKDRELKAAETPA